MKQRLFPRALIALAALSLATAIARPPSPTPPPAVSLSSAPSRSASYGGYRVHYKSFGSGRTAIVFVHGLGSDLSAWRYQAPAFAGRFRLVLLDLPGHGESDKSGQLDYSIRFHALALESVIRDAGVDRAVLVGHSMGTPVIREFYRMYPGRVSALVAVDGSLRQMVADPAAVEKFVGPYRGAEYPARLERFADSVLATPSTSSAPAWRNDLRRAILATPQPVFVRSFEGLFDPAIWKDDRIAVPLLVVVARNPFWSPEYETYVRALGPDVEYRVIENSGHFLMLEKADDFNRILLEFLSRRGLPGPSVPPVTPRKTR